MIKLTLILFISYISGHPVFIPKNHSEKIIGGLEAKLNQFPFHVAIFVNNGRRYNCGGSILNERYILTAAHCVEELEPKDVLLKLGTITLNSNRSSTHSITKITPHPSYNSRTKQNDICLLKTANQISFSPSIQPIPLSYSSPPPGTTLTAIGWGFMVWESDAPIPNELHYVTLKVLANEECRHKLKHTNVVSDWQVCTVGEIGKGVCSGDSGGGLIWGDVLVGVVSWGIPCGIGYPDVFTNIARYSKWVKDNIVL